MGLGLGLGLAFGAGQMLFGGIRSIQGKNEYERALRNLPKTEFNKEITANQTLAKSAYQSGMPGADIAKNLIYGSTQAGLSRAEDASQSSIDLLGATTEMYAKELEGLNSLAYQDAQFRTEGLDRLMGANKDVAAEKNRVWETNVWTPAQMKLNIAQSKMQSGQSMFQKGIGDTVGTLSSYLTEKNRLDQMNKIFGSNTGSNRVGGTFNSNSNSNSFNFDANLHNMFLNSH